MDISRGTKLYRNIAYPLDIRIYPEMPIEKIQLLVLQGNSIGIVSFTPTTNILQISPHEEYLLVNLTSSKLQLEFSTPPHMHEILFDPYRYENSPFSTIVPEKFAKIHFVPSGYTEVLPKWYSIKFTYPDRNLIFIRPHLGISIQSHTKRSENWELLEGYPIIIANSHVHYSTSPGTIYRTDIGEIHGLFNPTDEWVLIEESYGGAFDEKDIVRVFNPNHYD